MYGKCFASMYEGSMMGKGPEVFAVWPYVLANASDEGFVELNPFLVGVKIGMKTEEVKGVIEEFLSPDPQSRSKELEGRKLEKLGEFLYRIVNHGYYRAIRNAEDRKEQNRLAQARYRERHPEKVKRKRAAPPANLPDGLSASRLAKSHGQEAADALADRHDQELDEIRQEQKLVKNGECAELTENVPHSTSNEKKRSVSDVSIGAEGTERLLQTVQEPENEMVARGTGFDGDSRGESKVSRASAVPPETGQSRSTTVPEVRRPENGETSPGLPQAAGSGMALPQASSGTPSTKPLTPSMPPLRAVKPFAP